MAITKEIISNALLANEKYSSYTLSKLMRNTKDTLLKMFDEIGGDLNSLEPKKEKKTTKLAKVDLAISNDTPNLGATYSVNHYAEYKKLNDKNIFEDVIDNLMIDEILGKDIKYRDDKDVLHTLKFGTEEHTKAATEFKADVLNPLNRGKKRLKILKFLSEQNSVYANIINIIKKKESKFSYIKDVIRELREYVKVGEVEKKKFGEVMTPLELVKDMMATLPEETWSNPELKILDPANGCGPFPAYVIYKLMIGLAEWQPDEELRYKHIIENMIYVAELQPKNMFLWLFTIDPKDEYKPNIYCGSFLESGFDYHMKNVWGVEKFDIVIGNPPYQELKEGNTKSQPLWHLFVSKSIDSLKENGYLCLVHPSGWRNVDGVFKKIQQQMLSKEILKLNIYSFKDGLKTFGAKIDYDFYLLRNKKSSNLKTKIKSVDGNSYEVNISNKEFIPSENIEKIYSLVAKDDETRVELISDSTYHTQKLDLVSKQKIDEFKYPCVYMVKSGLNIVCWYSKLNKGHFGIPKVIFGNGACDVMIDINGEYGVTQFAYGIVDNKENLENIKKCLDNKEFIDNIMNYRDGLGDKYNRKVISLFKKDFWKEFI